MRNINTRIATTVIGLAGMAAAGGIIALASASPAQTLATVPDCADLVACAIKDLPTSVPPVARPGDMHWGGDGWPGEP